MARRTRGYRSDAEGSSPGEEAAKITATAALTPNRLRKQEFARRLTGLIEAKEWLQADLARAAKIGPASISSYVNAIDYPSPATMKRLARALGIDMDVLLPNLAEDAAKALNDPKFQIVETGKANVVWLDVHRLTSMTKALRVGAVLNEPDDATDRK